MISQRIFSLVQCPDCGGTLTGTSAGVSCGGCRRAFTAGDGYLDLRPITAFSEQTLYLDESLHADARHERVSPPLLGSAIRNDMLRSFLNLSPDDRVIDLGCGSGRTLVWNRDRGAFQVGLDVSPFFAEEALHGADLVLGDLRRLPFGDGAFTKGYALDVFEHLSKEGLADVVREASRVLAPGGQLFVYSHVRKNSRLAIGLRWINNVARMMERAGAIDLTQEHLRKSDHLNPLADIPDLERTVGAAGFRIAKIRYYTPIVGGIVENILMRTAEQFLSRRAARKAARRDSKAAGAPADAAERAALARAARTEAKDRIARGGPVLMGLRGLTLLMKLDILLFGRVRSGPFFVLLEKERTGA